MLGSPAKTQSTNLFDTPPNYQSTVTPHIANQYLNLLFQNPNATYFSKHLEFLVSRKANVGHQLVKQFDIVSRMHSIDQLDELGDYTLSLLNILACVPYTSLKEEHKSRINQSLAQHCTGDTLTIFHMAMIKNASQAVQFLLDAGIDTHLKNNSFPITPLNCAMGGHCYDAVSTLLVHRLKNTSLLSMRDFAYSKPKENGITRGGLYINPQTNEQWLIKSGHSSAAHDHLKEYVAGGLFQMLLGTNAPQTELVVNENERLLMTASKILPNFSTLSSFRDPNSFYLYPNTFPQSINGKPIEGFMTGVTAICFLGDSDGHSGNTGLIDRGDHYSFAKIDHSFAFREMDDPMTMLTNHLQLFYSVTPESMGFEAVYQSIKNITDIPMETLVDVIDRKFAVFQVLAQTLDLNSLFFGLEMPHAKTFDSKWAGHFNFLTSTSSSDQEAYIPEFKIYSQNLTQQAFPSEQSHHVGSSSSQTESDIQEYGMNYDLNSLKISLCGFVENQMTQYRELLDYLEMEQALKTENVEKIAELSPKIDFNKPILPFYASNLPKSKKRMCTMGRLQEWYSATTSTDSVQPESNMISILSPEEDQSVVPNSNMPDHTIEAPSENVASTADTQTPSDQVVPAENVPQQVGRSCCIQ